MTFPIPNISNPQQPTIMWVYSKETGEKTLIKSFRFNPMIHSINPIEIKTVIEPQPVVPSVDAQDDITEAIAVETIEIPKRKRGRPKDSKNKQ